MTIAFIPARMGSSRFPGKPLAEINGIPMVGHCWYRSKMSASLDEVYIVTCDQEIADYAVSIGAPCIMTSDSHERASDRVAEAVLKVEEQTGERHDIVVLIQGDEPMLLPEQIDDVVAGLKAQDVAQVANLVAEIETVEEFEDPNEVKVVVDEQGYALYFSREPIPSTKKASAPVPMRKQVCLIPFTREYLLEYTDLPQTPLEIAESVDMLRVMEHGGKVLMVPTQAATKAVDTPKDLEDVQSAMAGDPLVEKYDSIG